MRWSEITKEQLSTEETVHIKSFDSKGFPAVGGSTSCSAPNLQTKLATNL